VLLAIFEFQFPCDSSFPRKLGSAGDRLIEEFAGVTTLRSALKEYAFHHSDEPRFNTPEERVPRVPGH
jgi:hypothetical protein